MDNYHIFNSIDELISQAIIDLHQKVGGKVTNHVGIEYPTCILYFGEKSAFFHESIFTCLQEEWAEAADLIPCYIVIDPHELHIASLCTDGSVKGLLPLGARTNDRVSIKVFQQAINVMLGNRSMFANAKYCTIFCVIDTRDMKPEQFREWYDAIKDVRHVLTNITLNTMLLVLLDNSVGQSSVPITKELAEIYKEDEVLGSADAPLYEGVFLYSNRCQNGLFNQLFESHEVHEHGTWDVLADIMLLANSQYGQSSNCKQLLFSTGRYPAVTVAFKQEEKPYRYIAKFLLQHLLNCLDGCFENSKKQTLTESALKDALGFDGNGHQGIINTYNKKAEEIIDKYSSFANGLPSLLADTIDMESMSYKEVDEATFGCLTAFVEANHVHEIDEMLSVGGKGDFAEVDMRIEWQIKRSLSASQLISISKPELEKLINNLFHITYDSIGIDDCAQDTLKIKLYQKIAACLCKHAAEVTTRLYDDARMTTVAFDSLRDKVSHATSINFNKKFNLVGFYEKIFDSYYTEENLGALLRKILTIGNEYRDMLNIIYADGLSQLFSITYDGQSAFELEFMEELATRMTDGRSPDEAQSIIGSELVSDMPNNIGYRSLYPFNNEQQVEAYILHVDTALVGVNSSSPSKLLYTYLSKRGRPAGTSRVFLNIGRRDSASSLWFYALDTQHLRG